MRLPVQLACALLLALCCHPASASGDLDRDGLPDDLEQALLTRFAPTLFLSEAECDGQPAEFRPNERKPAVATRNGTLYGQVFRRRALHASIEIHYYHLWARDCGRAGHALDAEHVSALVRADGEREPADRWRATHWYAAAHEDTVCDAGHGARARALDAEDRGPAVWVSAGKHASFLLHSVCGRGCGGDQCERMKPMPPGKLVNLGEPGAPLNGALWTASPRWPLQAKMATDFTAPVLAHLENAAPDETVGLTGPLLPVQAVLFAGDTSIDAMATGNRHTEAALSTVHRSVHRALGRSASAVHHSLDRATRWLRRSDRLPTASASASSCPAAASPPCGPAAPDTPPSAAPPSASAGTP